MPVESQFRSFQDPNYREVEEPRLADIGDELAAKGSQYPSLVQDEYERLKKAFAGRRFAPGWLRIVAARNVAASLEAPEDSAFSTPAAISPLGAIILQTAELHPGLKRPEIAKEAGRLLGRRIGVRTERYERRQLKKLGFGT